MWKIYDRVSSADLDKLTQGKPVTMTLKHADGSTKSTTVNHTLNDSEINWFKAGSALNFFGQSK